MRVPESSLGCLFPFCLFFSSIVKPILRFDPIHFWFPFIFLLACIGNRCLLSMEQSRSQLKLLTWNIYLGGRGIPSRWSRDIFLLTTQQETIGILFKTSPETLFITAGGEENRLAHLIEWIKQRDVDIVALQELNNWTETTLQERAGKQ